MPTNTKYGVEKMQRVHVRKCRYIVRNRNESMARWCTFVGYLNDMLVFKPVKASSKSRTK